MKKNYFDPEMKISTFSLEDVVTTSGEITSTQGQEAYNNIKNNSKGIVQEISLTDIRTNYMGN